MAAPAWNRLIRFVPTSESGTPMIGEPVSADQDVGLAAYKGEKIEVNVYSGTSVLDPGHPIGKKTVHKLLSPLAKHEVGTIRCLGLNYEQHAREAKIDLPTVPTIFMKPSTALSDPFPTTTTRVPRFKANEDCCDYESELTIIIGKPCLNVSEAEALDYVLGYIAANDVSHRETQFAQSQWCYSKSFDGACPIGPCIVSTKMVPDPSKLRIRGIKNGKVMQDCGLDDLVFGVPKLVSFLSQGTTLEAGTIILTGTPAGVGFGQKPPEFLREGDVFMVEVMPGVGTLVNKFEDVKYA